MIVRERIKGKLKLIKSLLVMFCIILIIGIFFQDWLDQHGFSLLVPVFYTVFLIGITFASVLGFKIFNFLEFSIALLACLYLWVRWYYQMNNNKDR